MRRTSHENVPKISFTSQSLYPPNFRHIACSQGSVHFKKIITFRPCIVTAAFLFSCAVPSPADDTNLEEQVQLLRDQNVILQQQLQKQSGLLDTLTQKVKDLEAANAEHQNAASENPATPTT